MYHFHPVSFSFPYVSFFSRCASLSFNVFFVNLFCLLMNPSGLFDVIFVSWILFVFLCLFLCVFMFCHFVLFCFLYVGFYFLGIFLVLCLFWFLMSPFCLLRHIWSLLMSFLSSYELFFLCIKLYQVDCLSSLNLLLSLYASLCL